MSNERPSLRDTLCQLYAYHERLETELDCSVQGELAQHLPRGPLAKGKYLPHDRLRAEWELEQRVDRSFLVERGQKGLPAKESRAWNYAVHFVAEHLPGLADVNGLLETYCRFQLSQLGSEDKQTYWLTRAIGDLHGSVWRYVTEVVPDSRYTLLPDERRKLENALLRHPGYRTLAYRIRKLDNKGKGDELLRDLWERFPVEAKDADLPPEPPAPSVRQGDDTNHWNENARVMHNEIRNSPGAKIINQSASEQSSNLVNEISAKPNAFTLAWKWIRKAFSWIAIIKGWCPAIKAWSRWGG